VAEGARLYGNQYGHWIVFEGELAEQVDAACKVLDITPEEFLERALASAIKGQDR